jgi:hypothetical protein
MLLTEKWGTIQCYCLPLPLLSSTQDTAPAGSTIDRIVCRSEAKDKLSLLFPTSERWPSHCHALSSTIWPITPMYDKRSRAVPTAQHPPLTDRILDATGSTIPHGSPLSLTLAVLVTPSGHHRASNTGWECTLYAADIRCCP